MREITWHSILIIAVCAVLVCSPVSGTTITRHVELTLSPDQISDDGSFGSGVFWRPTFPLEPFLLTGPGDIVSVTISLSPGSRVIVFAGSEEQESAAALIGFPDGQNTFYDASWEFLGIEGDLFTPSLMTSSFSHGGGIIASFNPIDLTDSFFSFTGIRFSITILDDPRLAGLPATFDSGVVAVQTQGEVVLDFNGLDVLIDIKPGSDPNCININGSGVIPVAVLGSDSFDVTQIDVETLDFAGLAVRVRGNDNPQCSVEDVSGDFTTPEGAPDGYPDLVCQFVDDSTSWNPGDGTATLTGGLLDGTPFEGMDSICIVP